MSVYITIILFDFFFDSLSKNALHFLNNRKYIEKIKKNYTHI